jgi:hypothetical protein
MSNYLPSNSLEFQNMMHHIHTQATNNRVRWDISQAAISELDAPIAAFDAAVLISENPETRTSAAIAKRNRTRKDLEKVARPFIQGHLINNRHVTADDLRNMGLPVHDLHPTASPDPTEAPDLEAFPESAAVIKILFRRLAGRGKPSGVNIIEICMLVTDSPTPPAEWQELHESIFATSSPVRITRHGKERGKWLHLAGRWINTRGVKGPWCGIISLIIP